VDADHGGGWTQIFGGKASKLETSRLIEQEARQCRGTARRAILVNSCYVSRCIGVRNVSNSKSDVQGHWQWCHL